MLTAFAMAIVLLGAAAAITALPSHHSLVQFHGSHLVFGRRALLALGQLVQAPFDATSPELGSTDSVQATPLIAIVLPIGTAALAIRLQASALTGFPPAMRLAWGAATGVPFTVIMTLLALISRTTILDGRITETYQVAPDTVFALSLIWGGIGGALGAWFGIPPADRPRPKLPAPLRPALTHLAAALAISTAIMTLVVAVQTGRDAGGVQAHRGALGAIVENSTFALEHGIHGLQLGMLGEFTRPQRGNLVTLGRGADGLALPVPIARFHTVAGHSRYHLAAFKDALSGITYLLALLVLIGVPAALCLRGGWACARARGTLALEDNMIAGATIGPVWAIAITALAALADKTQVTPYFGVSDLSGTFVAVLLMGSCIGALGGAFARPTEAAATTS